MKHKFFAILAVFCGLLGPANYVWGEDIDLYVGGEASTGAQTNVLIVLDNSTNWAANNQGWVGGKQGEAELEALAEVLGTLGDNVNVGLLLAAGSNGGYVRFAIREMNTTNRTAFQTMLNTMVSNFGNDGDNDDKVNTASIVYDNMMNAAFRYFNGLARFGTTDLPSGSATDLRDYSGNNNSALKQPAFPNALGNYSLASSAAATYTPPPATSAGCAKNFIIFVGNGYPNQAGAQADITTAAALLGVTPDVSAISGGSARWADEWARFMYTYGVKSVVDNPASTTNPKAKLWNNISTYTIDVCKDACEADQATLLKSMAKVGGGKYFKSTSKAEIKNAMALIFAEIQAVNSVFASATLPISVNTQGTYENQVYIGVFRPDAGARPRWFGNLKEYKFGRYCDFDGKTWSEVSGKLVNTAQFDKVLIDRTRSLPLTGTFSATDERVADDVAVPDCGYYKDAANNNVEKIPVKLYLADQDGYRAIDEEGNTGFIDLSAKSYWTSDSSFWSHLPSLSGSISDSPDGPNVERGGAAQRLRTKWGETATSPHPDGRKVFTCLSNCLGAVVGDSARTLTSSGNELRFGNAAVDTQLAAPSGSVSATLSRTGNTVTVTTTSSHGFVAGNSVVIAGATPSAYNGTQTVDTVPTTTSFTYPITETPGGSAGTASASSPAVSVSSISLSSGLPGATVTATVIATSSLLGAAGTSATLAGSGLSYINGARVRVNSGPSATYTFSTTLPAAPAASGNTATMKLGTDEATGLAVTYSAATNRFTITSGSNLPGALKNAAVNSLVTVSAATDSQLNGVWAVTDTGTKALTFSFVTYSGCSPCTGVTIAEAGAASDPITIARTVGSATATATRTGNNLNSMANGDTITISGADSAYNGNWVVGNVVPGANGSFTFGPVTLSPSSPPTGTITATLSGAGTGPTTSNLISWLRGKDLWEDENVNNSLTDVRASIHGDVLHARPVVVNYGSAKGLVGFYGANDGFLRAVKGGVLSTDGEEKWAFIPEEFMNYSKLARSYANSEVVRYPNLSCSVTPTPTARNYFWDGNLTAYQSNDGTADTAPTTTWLFASMRRGGRAVYAFDVSDPDVPKVLWRISNTMINGGASTDYAELGQTWSEPKVIKLKGIKASDSSAQSVVALAFGAGYDAAVEDKPTGVARQPTMGRGVFITNAGTGARLNLLQPSGTPASGTGGAGYYSFAADVTPVDIDADGYVDRIYAADTGGNIWRFDAVQTAEVGTAGYWKIYNIAKVGDYDNNGGTNARKFLFAPEVLPFKKAGVLKTMIFIGSGDREKPLPNFKNDGTPEALSCPALYSDTYFPPGSAASYKVYDRFFGLVDTVQTGDVEATVNANPIYFWNLQQINSDNLANNTVSAFDIDNPAYRGWQIWLRNNPDGDAVRNEEKTVNQARVVGGVVYFATNTPISPNPNAGICSNLGEARGYAVDPFTGLPALNRDGSVDASGNPTYTTADFSTKFAGGGLPPTVTAGVVTIGGTPYRFIIGSGGESVESASSISGQRNVLNLKGIRSRLYWSYGAD